ncbi:MAG: signal peptidase I [Candidatus Woesearchaeota archaeon]
MRFGLWALIVLSFTMGLVTATTLSDSTIQFPSSPLSLQGAERIGPQDWISQEQILVTQEKVEINIQGAQWARFAPTGSMKPVLDQGAYGIQIIPEKPEQLQIGDIITYDYNGRKIIHRIVDIQQDSQGYYYTLKGDNNPTPDPVKVRFEDIERVLVAIIY